jgi:hypothetical protein
MNTVNLNVSDMAARRASRKAARRLIPFLILCFLVGFLDRVNIGFAAHEQGVGPYRRDVRIRRGRLLLRLLYIRGAV